MASGLKAVRGHGIGLRGQVADPDRLSYPADRTQSHQSLAAPTHSPICWPEGSKPVPASRKPRQYAGVLSYSGFLMPDALEARRRMNSPAPRVMQLESIPANKNFLRAE